MILMAPLERSLKTASAFSYSDSGKLCVISSPTRIRPLATNGITRRISPAEAREPTSSSSSSTSDCMRSATSSVGMPTMAQRPPRRSIAMAQVRVSGTPAHSRTTSAPRPPVSSRTAATGSPAVVSTVSKPMPAAFSRR
jgi:hypothetical protein